MKYTTISSSEIFEDLCDKIRRLELQPGSMISENEIAANYNVSRSTVRTAFSKLEQINLINRYPQIGTYINTFDLKYIDAALRVRNLVEMNVIEEVIKLENKGELLKRMEKNIELQETFRGATDYEDGFNEVDAKFHNMIIESVEKRLMMDIIHDSFIHIARWKNFIVKRKRTINSLIDEHVQIFGAIDHNDVKLAKEAMTNHLINMDVDFVSTAKKNYPNYF